MYVKELLQDAILNLNLNARDPKVISRAVSLFNSIMRRYSGNNIMTAYQNSVDFVAVTDIVRIGKYALRDGLRDVGQFKSSSALPDASAFFSGVDVAYVAGAFMTPATDGLSWVSAGGKDDVCTFFPDVLRPDMSDVVSIAYDVGGGRYKALSKVPFANFFTDGRPVSFSFRPIGENKVEILLKGTVGRTHKLIYTTSMKFDENSVVELPEIYLPLVSAALTEDLGNAFPAVDETIVRKYSAMRERIESDVSAKNTDDRMVLREDDEDSFSFNRVDMWRV